MRDHILEEVLRPGRCVDISRPARQLTVRGLPEQRRTSKGQISQHSEFALQRQRKNRLGRLAVGYRIVHLDEIERVVDNTQRSSTSCATTRSISSRWTIR